MAILLVYKVENTTARMLVALESLDTIAILGAHVDSIDCKKMFLFTPEVVIFSDSFNLQLGPSFRHLSSNHVSNLAINGVSLTE